MDEATKTSQLRLDRVAPSYFRVVLHNPPLNLMGPEFVSQIREIVTALEEDDRVKVVVVESAVDGFFLNPSDFLANFEDLTSIPQGPTGLEAHPNDPAARQPAGSHQLPEPSLSLTYRLDA